MTTSTLDRRDGTSVLQIRGLCKTYGSFQALNDVSLEVDAGEIFALLGPNGAGKTTLIGIVAGLVKRSAGEVRVAGYDVTRDYLQARRAVGLVPQEVNFDPFFNVEELLRFQAGYFGVDLSAQRLDELLAAVGLTEQRKRNSRALSGGMKRRLLIAKALVHEPKILFLDEPTAGVDVELRRDLWAYVRTLKARGTTVVLTTHYLEEAEELADRVGVIDRGRLLLVEDKRSLLARLGTRVVHATLSQPTERLPDSLLQAGWSTGADNRTLRWESPPQTSLAVPLQQLFASGLEVQDLSVQPPRLEDVFLRLVGNGGGRS